jgi:hypothetical protein
MVFSWYFHGIFMVFSWYFHGKGMFHLHSAALHILNPRMGITNSGALAFRGGRSCESGLGLGRGIGLGLRLGLRSRLGLGLGLGLG